MKSEQLNETKNLDRKNYIQKKKLRKLILKIFINEISCKARVVSFNWGVASDELLCCIIQDQERNLFQTTSMFCCISSDNDRLSF